VSVPSNYSSEIDCFRNNFAKHRKNNVVLFGSTTFSKTLFSTGKQRWNTRGMKQQLLTEPSTCTSYLAEKSKVRNCFSMNQANIFDALQLSRVCFFGLFWPGVSLDFLHIVMVSRVRKQLWASSLTSWTVSNVGQCFQRPTIVFAVRYQTINSMLTMTTANSLSWSIHVHNYYHAILINAICRVAWEWSRSEEKNFLL